MGALRRLTAIAIVVFIKFLVIFANFAPICAYILYILHDEKYITTGTRGTTSEYDPKDKAAMLLAMFKLIATAMFATNEGRVVVASWLAVTIVNTLYDSKRGIRG
jgi:hypothetical protein